MWGENECCNKWANVFVIVSNYTGCNNSVKVEPVCGPYTLTRRRTQDIQAPYQCPGRNTSEKNVSIFIHWNLSVALMCWDRETFCCISFTCVFYWVEGSQDISVFNLLNCFSYWQHVCMRLCACVCARLLLAVKNIIIR